MSIYVEMLVRAPLDALWRHTQSPELHERWDVRFSRIEYLPKSGNSDVQVFRYTTRLGFGIEVSGEGETFATRDLGDGSRVSALRFGSPERVSIIREGRGYWKYIPTADGIRFLTSYDYRTRFGRAGALFDQLVFRPLLGWATAWSFDRLRLWMERRVDPAVAMRQSLVHLFARTALAAVFFYQGLVPKIVARHADEFAMIREAGIPMAAVNTVLVAVGWAEIALAAALVFRWRERWPARLCILVIVLATTIVVSSSPRFFAGAFNPFALNVAVAALAVIDVLVMRDLPTSTQGRRAPFGEHHAFDLSAGPRH